MQCKPSAPPPAPKGLTAELCAVIADHTRRHPCLAVLLRPLWDCLRRLTATFDRLFAELHALAHAPIAIAAPMLAPAAAAPPNAPPNARAHTTTRSIRARARAAAQSPRRPRNIARSPAPTHPGAIPANPSAPRLTPGPPPAPRSCVFLPLCRRRRDTPYLLRLRNFFRNPRVHNAARHGIHAATGAPHAAQHHRRRNPRFLVPG